MRTIDELDFETTRAATVIRRGSTALASRARVERAGRLSLNQVAVLGRLAIRGPITPGELAHQLKTAPQSLTRSLAALEAEGLLVRTADPADGRQSLLGITEAGRVELRAEMAPRDAWVARAIAATLSDAERDLLVVAARLMDRLADYDADIAVVEG